MNKAIYEAGWRSVNDRQNFTDEDARLMHEQ